MSKRLYAGPNNGRAKYTWDQVAEIRRLAKDKKPYEHKFIADLCKKMNACPMTIHRIITNQTYVRKRKKSEMENTDGSINRLVAEVLGM